MRVWLHWLQITAAEAKKVALKARIWLTRLHAAGAAERFLHGSLCWRVQSPHAPEEARETKKGVDIGGFYADALAELADRAD